MKDLIIIGARGFGREVYSLARDCQDARNEFVVKGFLDDKSDALDGFDGYPPIIDSVERYVPSNNDVFICALGNPHWQKHYAEIILQKGGVFISLIHPSVFPGRNTIIGKGCIILKNAVLSCDISLHDFVTCQGLCILGHDVIVEDYCHIGSFSMLGGYSHIKSLTTLHPGSIILPHITVEDHCTVGAGAVVIRTVKSGTTVFGNPAKVLDF